jgi:hypothetical protein
VVWRDRRLDEVSTGNSQRRPTDESRGAVSGGRPGSRTEMTREVL